MSAGCLELIGWVHPNLWNRTFGQPVSPGPLGFDPGVAQAKV